MDEKMKILDMLKEGKLNTKEAEKLLKALGADSSEEPVEMHYAKAGVKNNLKGKLKIIVDSAEGENVRIAIPLRLSRMVAGMIPKSTLSGSMNGIDLNAILDSISEGATDFDEDIVNIDDGEGTSVRIFIEK